MHGGLIQCETPIGCEVVRRDEVAGRALVSFTPGAANVRPIEEIYPQQSPDPVRYGDTASRPARMPIVTFLATREIHAVQQDEFTLEDLWAPTHIASTPTYLGYKPEGVLPWVERTNMERPEYTPYGSSVSADHETLMGAA